MVHDVYDKHQFPERQKPGFRVALVVGVLVVFEEGSLQ